MKRVLHIVRSTLPAHVAGPDDVVIYTLESQAEASPRARIWLDTPHEHSHEHAIDTHELLDLVFQLDTVVVW